MGRAWTTKELKFLEENYISMEAKEIAIKLNRSYLSIMSKVRKLELCKLVNKEISIEDIEEFKDIFKAGVVEIQTELLLKLQSSEMSSKPKMVYLMILAIDQQAEGEIPLTNEMISRISNEPLQNIRLATSILIEYGYLKFTKVGPTFVFTIE